ncbi:MAG: hypothetical protein IJP02_06485 [Oscillospiraceae bacterium]|nr:hypothetical protein [Oscillospiraceae bacterium]
MYRIYKLASNTVVDFAAEELKKYLRMMMPRCGDITIEYKPDATNGFRLGLMSDFGLSTAEETQEPRLDDIVHIDTDGEGGIIAGSNYRSVLLAVYDYLKKNGCRWLFPGVDGEFIPIQNIVPVQYHKMADMRYRGQCNEGAESQQVMMESIDFTPKVGLNCYMIEFDIPRIYYEWYYNHKHNDQNRDLSLWTTIPCCSGSAPARWSLPSAASSCTTWATAGTPSPLASAPPAAGIRSMTTPCPRSPSSIWPCSTACVGSRTAWR